MTSGFTADRPVISRAELASVSPRYGVRVADSGVPAVAAAAVEVVMVG